jgi:hypothetical protein
MVEHIFEFGSSFSLSSTLLSFSMSLSSIKKLKIIMRESEIKREIETKERDVK